MVTGKGSGIITLFFKKGDTRTTKKGPYFAPGKQNLSMRWAYHAENTSWYPTLKYSAFSVTVVHTFFKKIDSKNSRGTVALRLPLYGPFGCHFIQKRRVPISFFLSSVANAKLNPWTKLVVSTHTQRFCFPCFFGGKFPT